MVKDGEDWPAAIHGSQRVRHNLATEQQICGGNSKIYRIQTLL